MRYRFNRAKQSEGVFSVAGSLPRRRGVVAKCPLLLLPFEQISLMVDINSGMWPNLHRLYLRHHSETVGLVLSADASTGCAYLLDENSDFGSSFSSDLMVSAFGGMS